MPLGGAKLNTIARYVAAGGGVASGPGSLSYYGNAYDLSGYNDVFTTKATASGGTIQGACVYDADYVIGAERLYQASGNNTGLYVYTQSSGTMSNHGTLIAVGGSEDLGSQNQSNGHYTALLPDTDNNRIFVVMNNNGTLTLVCVYNINMSALTCSISNVVTLTESFGSSDPLHVSLNSDGTLDVLGAVMTSGTNYNYIYTISNPESNSMSVSRTTYSYTVSGTLEQASKIDKGEYLAVNVSGSTAYLSKFDTGTKTSIATFTVNSDSSWRQAHVYAANSTMNVTNQHGSTVYYMNTFATAVSDTMTWTLYKGTTSGVTSASFTNDTDPNSRAGGWGNGNYSNSGTAGNGEQFVFLNRYGSNQLVIYDNTNGFLENRQIGLGGSESYQVTGGWADNGYLMHGSANYLLIQG